MPIATVRGVDIHYEILGERGPFVVLQPGGRRAGAGVRSLGEKIAEAGYRVVAYDRRNTGASSIAIEGESENDEWVEDLHELLAGLDALPAYIGGSSSGCRLAVILALRRPEDVRVHPRLPGQVSHRLMPNAEYHEVLAEDRMDLDIAFEDWEKKEGLLAAIFIDFLRRQQRR